MCDGLSSGGCGKASSSQGCGDTSAMAMTFGVNSGAGQGWLHDPCGQGLHSLELPGTPAFPHFSNIEAFILSKGSAMLLHPSKFSHHSSSSTQPHWLRWFGVVRMKMEFFPAPLLLLLYSHFQPHLWSPALRFGAVVPPRCLQDMMLSHSLEKSMGCLPLLCSSWSKHFLVSL